MPKIHVQYFAVLREQRGRPEETFDSEEKSVEALYRDLSAQHRFTLPAERIRIAVNEEFVAPTYRVRDGDRIVFIPPVAGG